MLLQLSVCFRPHCDVTMRRRGHCYGTGSDSVYWQLSCTQNLTASNNALTQYMEFTH